MTMRNPAVFIVAMDADDRVCLVTVDRSRRPRSTSFLAREIERVDDAVDSRAEEGIDTVAWVAFGEVLRMIADGRITDGETIAAIALAGIRLGRFR